MKTGIVFKIEGRKAVVLKPDGSFVPITAKSGWKVGETVPIGTTSKIRSRQLLAMASCFVIVLLAGLGWNQLYTSPTAIISLDVNPSIELRVNRWGRVVSAAGLNEEGNQILSKANTKNAVYQNALASIINAEGEYMIDNANVVLTVFSSDETMLSSIISQVQNVVDSQISNYTNQVNAEYHAVDENTVTSAHGHGITAGKYLYLQELQKLEPETNIDEYTHHSIGELKGEIEECKQKRNRNGEDNGNKGNNQKKGNGGHH